MSYYCIQQAKCDMSKRLKPAGTHGRKRRKEEEEQCEEDRGTETSM